MAVMSALLGFTSERRWLRHVSKNLAGMFPRRIGQSGYNKRVRKSVLAVHPGDPDARDGHCAVERRRSGSGLHSGRVRPVPGDRQAQRRRRWAEYGYCASHSRFFWGLRLHLVCTLSGLPVLFAIAGAKADERQTLLGMLDAGRDVMEQHPGRP